MIVSRKDHKVWVNLEGYNSRLSGPYYKNYYLINYSWHRLYGISYEMLWDLNNKPFREFKEV